MPESSLLKVLYLARYAPPNPSPFTPTTGAAGQYHKEIFDILRSLPIELTTATDPACLFDSEFQTDYVFGLYNKAPYLNSEIFVSSVCEYRHFAYLGAPPHIRAVAEDKHLGKIVAMHLGIDTAPWKVYRAGMRERVEPPFTGPYFVKPRFGSASEYIDASSLVSTWDECFDVIENRAAAGIDVLVEQFVDGWNVTVPVVATSELRILSPVRATSTELGNIITYRQKRLLDPGLSREILLDDAVISQAQSAALTLSQHVVPFDYLRIDFRWDVNRCKLVFLELNICCNLGSHSSFVLAAEVAGYTQRSLVELILRSSLKRQHLQWEHL